MSGSGRGRVVGIVLLVVLAAAVFASDPRSWLPELLASLQAAGPAGRALFGLGYVVATVLFLPASVITLASGFAWGPVGGTLVVWPSATIGAIGAFLLGRTLLRGPVEQRFGGDPRFVALDAAVAADGLKLVLLLRLSPLFPFNALNYMLGLTGVSLRDYAIGTAVGILPGTALYVYLGSTAADLASLAQGPGDAGASGRIASAIGLIATLGVAVYSGRMARRALAGRLEAPPPESP